MTGRGAQTTSVGYTLDSRSGAMMTSVMTLGVIADGTRYDRWQVFSPAQVQVWMKARLTPAHLPLVHGKHSQKHPTRRFRRAASVLWPRRLACPVLTDRCSPFETIGECPWLDVASRLRRMAACQRCPRIAMCCHIYPLRRGRQRLKWGLTPWAEI